MKRKKKFPKMKRALPLALVVVMMMTMFVVSASASVMYRDTELCDHLLDYDNPIYFFADVFEYNDDDARIEFTCPECGQRFEIGCPLGEPAEGDRCKVMLGVDGDTNEVWVDLFYYSGDTDSKHGATEYLTYANKLASAAPPSTGTNTPDSMVGEMTDTITTSFGGLLKGVGASIVNFFDKTIIAENGGLTTLATWTLAFLGIGFGFMVVKFITNKVRKK